ncbi:hypothetical protein HELRODRAFT_112157 [Helobdella robusta]|uniref:leucine--tRNA ligase n=1 Tax=Helobdella robusta TaxID=6412 RepID=T1EFH3_HELRO|nr:hypothetical protein HELRODRAFT_112157 [Helobdella robusta]ESO03773.1 hypothetical protein HELRODRAFT_112157 [Helobdella robusta]
MYHCTKEIPKKFMKTKFLGLKNSKIATLTYSYFLSRHVRFIFSKTGVWAEQYTVNQRKEVEEFWKGTVTNDHVSSREKQLQPSSYILSMFPYPSGKLHMGHVRVYTISDVMARYKRLKGHQVIHPMGWDAFGLPAENAAIERGIQPSEWTLSNIKAMKEQLLQLGCSFDWDREVTTCNEDYYRWTQHIFIMLHQAGLVYQKMAPVNYDPVDKTVLADEQIDEEGRSWRSGVEVQKVLCKQWYVRTTAYSKSLYDGLNEVDEELWRDIISLQRNWIGQCDGVRFQFQTCSGDQSRNRDEDISIFTKHPLHIANLSHILLSPNHTLNRKKFYKVCLYMCLCLNIQAVNPFTGRLIPLFVSFTHSFGEFLDHHLAFPMINKQDNQFASEMGILFKPGETFESLNNLLKRTEELKIGSHVTSEKARDWLISRQRYWGTPIPIVHCKKYGVRAVPVSLNDLPVKLPPYSSLPNNDDDDDGDNNNNGDDDGECDCDGYGERETDTMDTFVDSSWYFLRYLDAKNLDVPFRRSRLEGCLPVDLYIGGKEHAIMHLYYARFLHHFFHDLNLTPCKEPFRNLLTQGMVLGQSHKTSDTNRYLRADEVTLSQDNKTYIEKATNKPLKTCWEKMSKSKHNGVDPQSIMDEYGCDSTRLAILANVSPKSDRQWSNEIFVGVLRWQRRLWALAHKFISLRSPSLVNNLRRPSTPDNDLANDGDDGNDDDDDRRKKISFHLERTFLLSTSLSRMQMLSTILSKYPESVIRSSPMFERTLCDLVIVLSPFAPMFALELWEGLKSVNHTEEHYDWNSNVLKQKWPEVNDDFRLPMSVKVGFL